MVESNLSGKFIYEIAGLDMCLGDFKDEECETKEKAFELCSELLKDPHICATWAYENTLWVKKAQNTKPQKSNKDTHSQCVSFFLVEEDGTYIDGLDLFGGDIEQIEVASFDDAKYEAKKRVVNKEMCATFDRKENILYIKKIHQTCPQLSQNHHDCVSFFYREAAKKEE